MQTHQIGNSREQTSMMARAALKIVLIPTEKYTYTVQSCRMRRSVFPLPQSTSLVPPPTPLSPPVLFYHSSTPSSSSLHWPNTPKFSPFPLSPPPPPLPHFSLIHPSSVSTLQQLSFTTGNIQWIWMVTLPSRKRRSQMVSTVSQQGRVVKRHMNQEVTYMSGCIPRLS